MDMRKDADRIIEAALQSVMPDQAVIQALSGKCFGEGRVYLVAAGKAAWQMAKTAAAMLGERLQAGVCVTKYGHVKEKYRRSHAMKPDIPCRTRIPFGAPRRLWTW